MADKSTDGSSTHLPPPVFYFGGAAATAATTTFSFGGTTTRDGDGSVAAPTCGASTVQPTFEPTFPSTGSAFDTSGFSFGVGSTRPSTAFDPSWKPPFSWTTPTASLSDHVAGVFNRPTPIVSPPPPPPVPLIEDALTPFDTFHLTGWSERRDVRAELIAMLHAHRPQIAISEEALKVLKDQLRRLGIHLVFGLNEEFPADGWSIGLAAQRLLPNNLRKMAVSAGVHDCCMNVAFSDREELEEVPDSNHNRSRFQSWICLPDRHQMRDLSPEDRIDSSECGTYLGGVMACFAKRLIELSREVTISEGARIGSSVTRQAIREPPIADSIPIGYNTQDAVVIQSTDVHSAIAGDSELHELQQTLGKSPLETLRAGETPSIPHHAVKVLRQFPCAMSAGVEQLWKADALGQSLGDNTMYSVSLCFQRDLVEHYAWFHRPELIPPVLARVLTGELSPGNPAWSHTHVRPVLHLGHSLQPFFCDSLPGERFTQDKDAIYQARATYQRVAFDIVDGGGARFPLLLEFRSEENQMGVSTGPARGIVLDAITGLALATVGRSDRSTFARLKFNRWHSPKFFRHFQSHGQLSSEALQFKELTPENQPQIRWLEKWTKLSTEWRQMHGLQQYHPMALDGAKLVYQQIEALVCHGASLRLSISSQSLSQWTAFHPRVVVRRFTSAVYQQMFDTATVSMPSDLITLIGEYAPLDLPFVPLDANQGRKQGDGVYTCTLPRLTAEDRPDSQSTGQFESAAATSSSHSLVDAAGKSVDWSAILETEDPNL